MKLPMAYEFNTMKDYYDALQRYKQDLAIAVEKARNSKSQIEEPALADDEVDPAAKSDGLTHKTKTSTGEETANE